MVLSFCLLQILFSGVPKIFGGVGWVDMWGGSFQNACVLFILCVCQIRGNFHSSYEVFGAFLVHRDRSDVIEDADVCVKLVSACPMSSKPQPFVRKPVCFVGFFLSALRGGCAHVTLKVFEEERHRMSVL